MKENLFKKVGGEKIQSIVDYILDFAKKKEKPNKEKLKEYLKGTYDFNLSEIARISVLVGKAITIK
jgi:hypothetical protein